MKQIKYDGKNGKGLSFKISDESWAKIKDHKWWFSGHYAFTRFRIGKNLSKSVNLQSFLLDCPKGYEVDHIDGDKSNYQLDNLRICTRQQNRMNNSKRKTKCSSVFKGVTWSKYHNLWQAQIGFNGRSLVIGKFESERHAAMARDIWSKELHGEYAKLNFA